MTSKIKYCACATVMALVAMVSCNNDNCMGNSTGIPLAAFFNNDKKVTISNLTVYGIGAPNDSTIINNTNANQVYLPLRITQTSCQYVLNYNTEGIENDTLTFNYDIIPYFESRECGAMYNFKITSWEHTYNAIDSVRIPDPMITNSDVVTINIYMR
ncbi:MAG: hypothetical protein IKX31_10010 [Muribaculaceae bacterium]|nr:hypothetical protein [Muribaculaceae bacterium]